MASVDLSNAAGDVWDDSALIQSWNGALAEYKVKSRLSDVLDICLTCGQRYHSIHARGERVEDVLREHELAELKGYIVLV